MTDTMFKINKENLQLATNATLEQALDAMRVLNIMAKEMQKGDMLVFIYSLKDYLIAWLYENNYAKRVQKVQQKVACTDIVHQKLPARYCPRCKGTGIFAKNKVYVYIFEVGNRKFRWHQPVKNAKCLMPLLPVDKKTFPFVESYPSVQPTTLEKSLSLVWGFLVCQGITVEFVGNNEVDFGNRRKSYYAEEVVNGH